MSQKAIREFDGKRMFYSWLDRKASAEGAGTGSGSANESDAEATVPAESRVPVAEWIKSFRPGAAGSAGRCCEVGVGQGLDGGDELASVLETREELVARAPWLEELSQKKLLVAKPDQLVKRRGKLGLVCLRSDLDTALTWIRQRHNRDVVVEGLTGRFQHFILEPFIPHEQKLEHYVCVRSVREGEEILFCADGGVDVGDVDAKARRYLVATDEVPDLEAMETALLGGDQGLAEAHGLLDPVRRQAVLHFVAALWAFYLEYHLGYLEINPVAVADDGTAHVLDMACKIDETAHHEVSELWGHLVFPSPFGHRLLPEESYIRSLDAKTGSSLKLTVLNAKGRIWTMVAGGGASVVYADTISDLGGGAELANYGEYSGDPSETLTYEYAKTVLSLMTAGDPRPDGKLLIVGGGIANFTNVAQTFKGIVRAFHDYAHEMKRHKVRVFVRRGGPNYEEGLALMRKTGVTIGVPVDVYGPETHLTHIVAIALGLAEPTDAEEVSSFDKAADVPVGLPMTTPGSPAAATRKSLLKPTSDDGPSPLSRTVSTPVTGAEAAAATSKGGRKKKSAKAKAAVSPAASKDAAAPAPPPYQLFSPSTRAAVYGIQPRAVQGMLDFDHICGRQRGSVACMIFPFSGNHYQKFYWGAEEILVPVYEKMSEALKRHPDVTTLVNFSSHRSVFDTTMEALRLGGGTQLRSIAVIAEGVPERRARQLLREAHKRDTVLIGPATVGGIKPGCFRIGNTGGMLGNVLSSKLYRPGSVAYVSRSGGMSNELNNVICRNADGVYEGVAIGGDRFPGSTFIDHLLRFEADPGCRMLVLLGEVGGVEEYEIGEAVRSGRISKPLIAWCIGTCAKMFPYEVQFGHAGALAQSQRQTADAKNEFLRECGALVPSSFDALPGLIGATYRDLVAKGTIVPAPEPPVPQVPMDYSWASKLGLIRKPTSFVSSISDERGEELLYAGMPISAVFKENLGLGGVISLLWFRRRLPDYATKFLEMVLMLTADHGPAVAGAHNTIVASRAGKDLISSLCSGLLTIGPRFGGALDEAARQFSQAYDSQLTPKQFVSSMREQKKLIMGIGHKIKSVQNPDQRVTILKEYVKRHFPSTDLLDYAMAVEELTTAKRNNLILNVDGAIAVSFVDLMRGSGCFSAEEASDIIEQGVLNGLFVLGRSIGFIGHFMDQKRLKQPLYRHDVGDINYANV